MGFGYFLQGLASGIEKAKERKKLEEESTLKNEYMKAQKKVLDIQIKQEEIKDRYKMGLSAEERSLLERNPKLFDLMRVAQGKLGLPGMASGGMPTLGQGAQGGQGQEMQIPLRPPETMQPQQGGGLAEIIAKAQYDPLLRGMVKELGVDIQNNVPRTVFENNKQVTRFLNPDSREAFEEPPDVITQEVQTPEGTFMKGMDRYSGNTLWGPGSQQQAGPTMQGMRPFQTAPPEYIEVTEELPDGTQIKSRVNKYNPEEVLPGSLKTVKQPQGLASETIGKIQSAESGLRELNKNIIGNLLNPDGSINFIEIAKMQTKYPKSKGRLAFQGWKRAMDGITRPITGAAITPEEWASFIESYMPSFFDSNVGVDNKFEAMAYFLNGVIHKADPSGKFSNPDINLYYDRKTRSITIAGSKTTGGSTSNDPLGIR